MRSINRRAEACWCPLASVLAPLRCLTAASGDCGRPSSPNRVLGGPPPVRAPMLRLRLRRARSPFPRPPPGPEASRAARCSGGNGERPAVGGRLRGPGGTLFSVPNPDGLALRPAPGRRDGLFRARHCLDGARRRKRVAPRHARHQAMLGIKGMPVRGSGAGHGDASRREADARRLRLLRASREAAPKAKCRRRRPGSMRVPSFTQLDGTFKCARRSLGEEEDM